MHTPGPWAIGFGGMESDTSATITSPYARYSIAQLDPPGYNQANARLIAAAPELLKALTELTNFAARHSPGSKYVANARAAIAAATH